MVTLSSRQAIAGVDPNQPVLLSASLRSLVDDSVADQRFIMMLLTITGCLGLLVSVAGVYGVTSYVTSRRTQEIGLRMALRATPRRVLVSAGVRGSWGWVAGWIGGHGDDAAVASRRFSWV